MKSIIFDTGPIISLTMNNLTWVLEPLQKKFKGNFFITSGVKKELIDRPLQTKKFKFEALQAMTFINKGVLKVKEDKEIKTTAYDLLDLANKIFMAKNHWLNVFHYAEIETLACAVKLGASAVVIDERTTRMILEDPSRIKKTLGRKLHTKVRVNNKNLKMFRDIVKDVRVIRSVELVTIAYELGLLDKYIPSIDEPRKNLLDAVLWGVKLNGCSVSGREIDQIIKHHS